MGNPKTRVLKAMNICVDINTKVHFMTVFTNRSKESNE